MANIVDLPIYKHQDEINDALAKHQVIVVEGPTGCGKTTQLPRILLRNPAITGRIGLTQPRRIAAVSVANRIAKEIGCELGEEVGYAIRFDDKTSENTLLKVMTDGILLQESRTDHDYSEYQVLIIDEAHERSLNIDLALGLLKQALPKRPDLRVIISSATIKAEQFQRFFAKDPKDVPLISIQSRTYPVELLYSPVNTRKKGELPSAVLNEVLKIHKSGEPGHILTFLPGQGAIQDCENLINDEIQRDPSLSNLWVLPLYGLLPREDQERVFDEKPGKRKVVLSTNIAETSITIPDVRFVIDSGIAKIPRFDNHTNITTLREEPISKASLAQRAGRAGRTAPGKAIRLFSESILEERPDFTDEEITRLELSDVMLRIIDLGIHDIHHFPFPTRPPQDAIDDALRSLRRLGAIDESNHLTSIGEKMVPFPLLPRLARVVVEAGLHFPNVLNEVIIACAYLSVKSPYLYPPGHEMQAKKAHQKLASAMGDLITAIHVVKDFELATDKDMFCKRNYLEKDTMAFISRSREQLMDIAEEMGMSTTEFHSETDVIRAFLAAYGDQYLVKQGRGYVTTTNTPISLHPSSSLYATMPNLILATEFIESTRVYAEQASVLRSTWLTERGIKIAQYSTKHDRDGKKFNAFDKKQRKYDRYTKHLDEYPEPEKPAKERKPLPDAPLILGGVTLQCVNSGRSRQPNVIIPTQATGMLRNLTIDEIPEGCRSWKATVKDERKKAVYLRGYTLAGTIMLLKLLPFPVTEPPVHNEIPIGATLSAQRNINAIVKALPHLITVIAPHNENPGWLALASADDLLWFEINPDPLEALQVSMQALATLTEQCDDAKHLATIQENFERCAKLDAKLKKTLVAAHDL